MRMFETFLNSLPKNRYDMVTDLEIPDVTLTPFTYIDLEDTFSTRSDSIFTYSDDIEVGTASTDSSMPLSRAMTDSEIDYDRYRRYKNRRFSDPWLEMRAVLDNFPPGYLDSLTSFQTTDPGPDLYAYERMLHYNDELRLKMERFFAEDCTVFPPDDPGLEALEDAIRDLDMKALEADLDSFVVP